MKRILIVTAVLGLIGTASVRAQDFEYKFVSDPFFSGGVRNPLNNPSDGTPISEWTGELFLDSSSSDNGMISDIDLSRSFITSSQGTINLDNPDIVNLQIRAGTTFMWDALGITSMDITGFNNDSNSGFTIDADFINVQNPDPQDNGAWVAVPDSGSMGTLLSLALGGMFGFKRFVGNRRRNG